MCNLVIPVGIPGSGKSTWGQIMFGKGHYNVLCSDDIRRRIWGNLEEAHNCTLEEKKGRNEIVWKEFYQSVEDSLEHNVDVYADATNLQYTAREKLRKIAWRTNADLHLIIFDNVIQALRRNTEREIDKHVPKDVMDSFLSRFATVLMDVQSGEKHFYDTVTTIGNLGPND